MSNKKVKLKSIYNIIKKEAVKEPPIEITADSFPESLEVNYKEIADMLQELDDLGLIKFEGITSEIIHIHKGAIPIFKIHLLKNIDISELLEKDIIISNKNIEFLDNKAQLKLKNKACQLPAFKNEHFLCRAMFEFQIEEPVDWSIIYEKMTGEEPKKNGKKELRVVYDAMEAVNKRTMDGFGKKIFIWSKKTITRVK